MLFQYNAGDSRNRQRTNNVINNKITKMIIALYSVFVSPK